MPVRPASRNWTTNAVQKSIGVAKRILPPHMVASQLKILIDVGMPTSMVESTKKALPTEVIPMVNIWCAQTPRLTKAIPTEAATIAGYPKIALRENTGITSLAIAKAGSTST